MLRKMHSFMLLAITSSILLLLIDQSDAVINLKEEEDIALGLSEVIYKHRNMKGGQQFDEFLSKIAMELPQAICDYHRIYNNDKNYKPISKGEAKMALKMMPKFRDQIEKLFIATEMRKVINELKAETGSGHPKNHMKHQSGNILDKNEIEKEKGLRALIKAKVLANIKKNGLKIPENEEKKKVEQNFDQIISILLFFHEDDLVELEGGEKREHKKAKKPLRIAILSPNVTQTPPRTYGGTERIVSYLSEELIKRGHEVTLFASSDSITSAKLVFTEPALFGFDEPKLQKTHKWLMTQLEKGIDAKQFDVVHLNSQFLWENVSRMADKIALAVTIHFLIKSPDLAPLGYKYTNIPMISISNDQRNHKPSEIPKGAIWNPNFVKTIYHGLPSQMYKFVSKEEQAANLAKKDFPYGPKPYLSFLGRISPPKRPDIAILIAAKAETPLRIAALIGFQIYMDEGIKPLISLVNGQHREKKQKAKHNEKLHHEQISAQQKRINLVSDYLNALGNFTGIEDQNEGPIKELKEKYERGLKAFKEENVELLKVIEAYENEEEKMSEEEKKKALIYYVGEVSDEQKNEFLGNSMAMLFPIYWNEPFGLVMIESMAMGTPVITRAVGSVSEVINAKAGIIYGREDGTSEEEELEKAVAAVKKISAIDRRGVRKEFDERFTVSKMTEGYEELFHELVEKHKSGGQNEQKSLGDSSKPHLNKGRENA